jgi:hypothetical protein
MVSSLFNSNLLDFHEGWMYVLGVGIAGGMTLKTRSGDADEMPVSSVAAGLPARDELSAVPERCRKPDIIWYWSAK